MVGRADPGAGHEILEHTADLGIRAWGPSAEAAFEQAARGLIELLDVESSGEGSARPIRISSDDLAALLVDFLNELVFLAETEDLAVAGITVTRLADTELEAELSVAAREHRSEGVVVKAATYHQLSVDRGPDRTEVRVFLDV
jgi:SHS2 domain-containing protein